MESMLHALEERPSPMRSPTVWNRQLLTRFRVCAALAAMTAASFLPQKAEADDRPRLVTKDAVDLIEYNHFYDEQGKHVLDQLIFYDWCRRTQRNQVRDWRLIKKESQTPLRNFETDSFDSVWHDGLTLRKVSAPVMRETWTQFDPELIERENLPKERRRELTDVRKSTQEAATCPPEEQKIHP